MIILIEIRCSFVIWQKRMGAASQSNFDDNFQQSSLQAENYYPFVEPNFWFDLLAMLLIIFCLFFFRLVRFGFCFMFEFDLMVFIGEFSHSHRIDGKIYLITDPFSRRIYILRFNWIPLNDPKSHTNKYNDDDDDSFRFSIEMTMNWTELNWTGTERINCYFFCASIAPIRCLRQKWK